MKKLPFNMCIAFLAGFLMNFVTPAFSSPTPTPTSIPTPTVSATTTVSATPIPQPPTVTTGEATVDWGGEYGCLVTLSGTVNANGLQTTAWFEYGIVSSSYSGTSSTQTVARDDDTTVSMEIEVLHYTELYDWCTGETSSSGSPYYYYRIAAQNSAGISYGGEKEFENCYLVGDNWFCTPSPTLTPTPVGLCIIVGTVIDALSTSPIAGATVSTDIGGFNATTDATGTYTIPDVAAGDYTVTASATGYDSSSQPFTAVGGAATALNFALVPTLPTTPTPTPNCVPKSISASQSKLMFKRKQSKDLTVTVKGENDCLVDGETVTATINNAGKKRISILPSSAITDSNGETTFVITAKNKTGNARVTFKAGDLKKSIVVRVRR